MFLRALLLLVLLLPLSTRAAGSPGIALYERGNYAKAIRELKKQVGDRKRPESERALARVYLAASFLALQKASEAQQELEALARVFPEQTVDPDLFPPELVEMDRAIRNRMQTERLRREADQAEQERLAAEAAAERLKREQAPPQRPPDPVAQVDPPVRTEPPSRTEPPARTEPVARVEPPAVAPEVPASSWRIRPEVIGFADAGGWLPSPKQRGPPALGLGVGVTVGREWLEGSARALLGKSPALDVEVAAVLGKGAFTPRAGLRGTLIPVIEGTLGFGVGVVVGGRVALTPRLVALVDVSAQRFKAPDNYRSVVLLGSVGLGFNLH